MKKLFSIIIMFLTILPYTLAFSACDSKSLEQNQSQYNTVSFETNGGSKISERSCEIIEVSPTTIRENYNFIGWFFDRQLTTIVTFPLSIDCDMTLYAKWKKTREKITSDCMAYIDDMENQTIYNEEDNSSGNKTDNIKTTIRHMGNNFNFYWEKTRIDIYDNTNKFTHYYSLSLRFDYGEITSATGQLYYNYSFYTNTNSLYCSLNSGFTITSIEKQGNTYLMKGYFSLFSTYGNYTTPQSEVENSLQTIFSLSLYDFEFSFPVEYWNTIFYYSDLD